MCYLRHACWLGTMALVVGLWSGPAEANPALAALAQGSVVQFTGREAISEPFAYDVTLAGVDKPVTLSMAVGQPLTLAVAPGRVVSGLIERIEQVDGPAAQGVYRLHLVPTLQRLQYRTASRTFYGKPVIDVATQVLTEAGIANVELRIGGSLPSEEMLVQYQESDFAFVSRHLEGAGVHYHFEAGPGGERLVLSDGNAGFPSAGKVIFASNSAPSVLSFTRGQSMHAGQVQVGDYNWKTPAMDLSAAAQAPAFVDLTERLFPAGIETKVEAQAAASIRLASRIADAHPCTGESTYPQLQAGTRVVMTGHPRADFNQEYVITAVNHQKSGKEYRNTFRCIPAQIVYRPLPMTPTPLVAGVVSGIVIGPPGETKHVDQFGRVRVRFPWRSSAHSNPNDPGDGGFVRVAQIAAGIASAALWLPEVGDEVLVAFEHGDPRRPVVVGSVYNGKDMPPVALPANKHLALLRHQSVGGAKTEIVFDGTTGNERLVIQSGQNGLTLAATGITLHGPSVSISSTGDLVQRAGRTFTVDTGADLSVRAGQNLTMLAQRDAALTFGNNGELSIGANLQVSVGANSLLESGKDLSMKAGQHVLIHTQRTARLISGDDTVIQAGKALIGNGGTLFQFVAAQTGTLQAGDALLTLRRDGNMDLVGKDIAVIAGGNLTMKSTGNLVLRGAKITQN